MHNKQQTLFALYKRIEALLPEHAESLVWVVGDEGMLEAGPTTVYVGKSGKDIFIKPDLSEKE